MPEPSVGPPRPNAAFQGAKRHPKAPEGSAQKFCPPTVSPLDVVGHPVDKDTHPDSDGGLSAPLGGVAGWGRHRRGGYILRVKRTGLREL